MLPTVATTALVVGSMIDTVPNGLPPLEPSRLATYTRSGNAPAAGRNEMPVGAAPTTIWASTTLAVVSITVTELLLRFVT